MKTVISMLLGPVLALVTFFASYYLDPFGFGSQDVNNATPSFLLSVVVLLIGQTLSTHIEIGKTTNGTNRIYEAVRDCLHVTKVGPPHKAWQYVMQQLPDLECVQNTSFNYEVELERTRDRLYDKDVYTSSPTAIGRHVKLGLIWKDLGDETALDRFRLIGGQVKDGSKGKYEYRRITNKYPQIGFIILTYKDGRNEVLFNWDFHQRNIAQDPKVLLSRDDDIVEMFASHYQNLWDKASDWDYDSKATKSTSKK